MKHILNTLLLHYYNTITLKIYRYKNHNYIVLNKKKNSSKSKRWNTNKSNRNKTL